jgi:hypothetical protein
METRNPLTLLLFRKELGRKSEEKTMRQRNQPENMEKALRQIQEKIPVEKTRKGDNPRF